jgi:2-oxoisovalerate dehydrogenase E1 component
VGQQAVVVLPQTSTIASHLPKALGTALSRSSRRAGPRLPIPDDSIAICSFGDASSNHATAQTAFNTAMDGLSETAGAGAVRLRGQRHRHFGEDAERLDRRAFSNQPDLDYFYADGLDLATGYAQVRAP